MSRGFKDGYTLGTLKLVTIFLGLVFVLHEDIFGD